MLSLVVFAASVAAGIGLAGASPEPGPWARAARCELGAVGQTMHMIRGADAASATPQVEAIRHAAGRCTRFVLALTPLDEVPKVCAAPGSLTVMQTARELRRRMAAIDADALLRSSAVGRACKAAYRHELKTTRVVLRERR